MRGKEEVFKNSPNLSKNMGDGCPEGRYKKMEARGILGIQQGVKCSKWTSTKWLNSGKWVSVLLLFKYRLQRFIKNYFSSISLLLKIKLSRKNCNKVNLIFCSHMQLHMQSDAIYFNKILFYFIFLFTLVYCNMIKSNLIWINLIQTTLCHSDLI